MFFSTIIKFLLGDSRVGVFLTNFGSVVDAFSVWGLLKIKDLLLDYIPTLTEIFANLLVHVRFAFDDVLETLGMSYLDFIALSSFLFAAGKFILLAHDIMHFLQRLYFLFLLKRMAHTGDVVHSHTRHVVDDLPVYTPEAAFGDSHVYVSSEKVTAPPGVFQVLMKVEEDKFLKVGHGFVAHGHMYTPMHVTLAVQGDLYIKNPALPQMIKATVSKEHAYGSYDFCRLECHNGPAILQLKSLKVKFVSNSAVRVLSYDSPTKSYVEQFVMAEKHSNDSNPLLLKTKSNTFPSDSGLPITQDGCVVAMHVGANNKDKTNLHVIPVPLLESEIRKKAARRANIFEGVSLIDCVAPESINIEEDDGRAVAIVKKLTEEEEEEKKKRMLGQHQDSQGFRKPKRDMVNPDLLGPSWYDEDCDEESGLKDQAPAQGAPQVPEQDVNLLRLQNHLLSQQLHQLEKTVIALQEKLSSPVLRTRREPKSGVTNSSPSADSTVPALQSHAPVVTAAQPASVNLLPGSGRRRTRKKSTASEPSVPLSPPS